MAAKVEPASLQRRQSCPTGVTPAVLNKKRHSLTNVGTTVSNVLKIAKEFCPEENGSSEAGSKESQINKKTTGMTTSAALKKRHSLANIGTTVSNVLKIAKEFSPEDNGAGEAEPKDKPNPFLKLAARRQSSTNSDKTGTTGSIVPNPLRRNTFKSFATAMMKFRMFTTAKTEPAKPKIRYENTYRLKPHDGKQIAVSKTEEVAKEVLEEMIGNKKYDERKSGELSIKISNAIKDRVKALKFPRYRIIVQVVLSQTNGQGLEVASRCVWDHTVDNYSCVTYSNDTTTATVLIYGVYLE